MGNGEHTRTYQLSMMTGGWFFILIPCFTHITSPGDVCWVFIVVIKKKRAGSERPQLCLKLRQVAHAMAKLKTSLKNTPHVCLALWYVDCKLWHGAGYWQHLTTPLFCGWSFRPFFNLKFKNKPKSQIKFGPELPKAECNHWSCSVARVAYIDWEWLGEFQSSMSCQLQSCSCFECLLLVNLMYECSYSPRSPQILLFKSQKVVRRNGNRKTNNLSWSSV